MGHVSSSVDAVLGLGDFRVASLYETDVDMVLEIETTETKRI